MKRKKSKLQTIMWAKITSSIRIQLLIKMNIHSSNLSNLRTKLLKITSGTSTPYLEVNSSSKCLLTLPSLPSISTKVLTIILQKFNRQYHPSRLNLISSKLLSRSKLFSLRSTTTSHWVAKRSKIKKEKSINYFLKKMPWKKCDEFINYFFNIYI